MKYHIKQYCSESDPKKPAYRQIYAYDMANGSLLAYAETNEFGYFDVILKDSRTVFLRIVDPKKKYSPEIRENLIPTPFKKV